MDAQRLGAQCAEKWVLLSGCLLAVSEQTSHQAECPGPHTLPAVMEPEAEPSPGTAQLTLLGWEPFGLALAGFWSWRWPAGTLNHRLVLSAREPLPHG